MIYRSSTARRPASDSSHRRHVLPWHREFRAPPAHLNATTSPTSVSYSKSTTSLVDSTTEILLLNQSSFDTGVCSTAGLHRHRRCRLSSRTHAQAGMSTLHLPEEILSLIVEHLQLPSAIEIGERRNPDFTGKLSDSDQDIKLQLFTLASLARTSLRLNRIVKPVLYRTYPGFPLANARTFIKTLAKDPVCAGSVHEIVIDKWEDITQDDQHTVDLESQSLKTSCLQYAQSMRRVSSCYPVGLGSAVGAKLERGRADVVLTMLMLLCDNIEVLEVSVPCLGFDAQRGTHLRLTPLFFMLDVLAYSKDHSEERYRKIRNLAIRLEKHMGVFGCAFANRLLSMPNVETFSGWRVNCSRLFTSRTIGIPDTGELPLE